MCKRQNIIWEFQRTINDVYNEYELKNLRGFEDNFIVNEKQIISWHANIVCKGMIKYSKTFNFFENIDDLIFCSDEILYFLAQMFLYRPYLNNPIEDGLLFGDQILYPNYQNLAAKRYSMFANIVSEKLYNYWDRIGDLIATYFPELIKPEQVYFSRVIDIIPKEYFNDENYQWLKNFKENHYKDLNSKRKQFVHYTTEDTKFKYTHLDNLTNRDKIETLIKNRNELADYYKEHLNLTLIGFEKTMFLIEKITEITLFDIE